MATQFVRYPKESFSGSISTGPVQFVLDTSDTEVEKDTATPSNNKPLPVQLLDTSGNINTVAIGGTVPLPSGAATAAKQDTGNASLASIDGKITAVNTGAVVVSSSALPTGASTSAKQDTGNTSLASIDGKITAVNTGAVVVSSSALPSGASTSAKQDTGNTSLASIDGKITAVNTGAVVVSSSALPTGAATEVTLSAVSAKLPATLGQKAMTASMAVVLASDQSALSIKTGGLTALAKARNDYSSGNVTTGAYTQLIASVGATAVREVEIFDSSGQTLLLATGAAASEVDQVYILPGGNGRIPLAIAASTRVAIKAVSGTASTGEISVNFYG